MHAQSDVRIQTVVLDHVLDHDLLQNYLKRYKQALAIVLENEKANADYDAQLALKYMSYLTDQLINWIKLEQKIQSRNSLDDTQKLSSDLSQKINPILLSIQDNRADISQDIRSLRTKFVNYNDALPLEKPRYFYSTIHSEQDQLSLWSGRLHLLAVACLLSGVITLSVAVTISQWPLIITGAASVLLWMFFTWAALPSSNAPSALEYAFFNSIWIRADKCLQNITQRAFENDKHANSAERFKDIKELIGSSTEKDNSSIFFKARNNGQGSLCEQVNTAYLSLGTDHA